MTNTKEIPGEVKGYLMALLAEKKLDNLPPGMMADTLYDLYIRLDDYMTTNLISALSDEKFNDVTARIKENQMTHEQLQAYLRENTDYQKVAEETLVEFKDIFLGNRRNNKS